MFALEADTPPQHLRIHRPWCAQGPFAALNSDNGYSSITGGTQASAHTHSLHLPQNVQNLTHVGDGSLKNPDGSRFIEEPAWEESAPLSNHQIATHWIMTELANQRPGKYICCGTVRVEQFLPQRVTSTALGVTAPVFCSPFISPLDLLHLIPPAGWFWGEINMTKWIRWLQMVNYTRQIITLITWIVEMNV